MKHTFHPTHTSSAFQQLRRDPTFSQMKVCRSCVARCLPACAPQHSSYQLRIASRDVVSFTRIIRRKVCKKTSCIHCRKRSRLLLGLHEAQGTCLVEDEHATAESFVCCFEAVIVCVILNRVCMMCDMTRRYFWNPLLLKIRSVKRLRPWSRFTSVRVYSLTRPVNYVATVSPK